MESILRVPSRNRRAVLEALRKLALNPFPDDRKSFTLANEPPFYVFPVDTCILTEPIDHAAKEVRLVAVE